MNKLEVIERAIKEALNAGYMTVGDLVVFINMRLEAEGFTIQRKPVRR